MKKQTTQIQTELKEIKDLLTAQQDKAFSSDEAYKYLHITKSYLRKICHLKQISYWKPNGKLVYFTKRDLDSWLFRNKHKSKAEIEAEAAEYLQKKGK